MMKVNLIKSSSLYNLWISVYWRRGVKKHPFVWERCARTKMMLFQGPGYKLILIIYGTMRDLAPFQQFTKREKHPWRSVIFSK